MPHVTIQYTASLDPEAKIDALCATLAEVILAQRDDQGGRLYPIGGTRVLAYPSKTYAVADGAPDRAFCYINVRIAPGRPKEKVQATGEALGAAVKAHFAAVFERRPIGITLQIDEGAPAFDLKHSNLHPLFAGK